MACDVFLIVFYRHDAEALRKLEMKYIGVITALVFIPAVVFLFIRTAEKGPIYGSVTVGDLPFEIEASVINTVDLQSAGSFGARSLRIGCSYEYSSFMDQFGMPRPPPDTFSHSYSNHPTLLLLPL